MTRWNPREINEYMRMPFFRRTKKPHVVAVGDPLEAFASEDTLPPVPVSIRVPVPVPVAAHTPPASTPEASAVVPERFSLATILERRTPIAWFEAVAIVDGLCAVVCASDTGELPVSDLAHTFITQDGSIVVEPGVRDEPAVRRLARTLHALLAVDRPPAPLRLFTARWMDSTEQHTAAAFAADLRYFARADGSALIAAVHQRCAAMPSHPVAPATPAPAPASPAARPAPERRRLPAWVVGAAAAAVAAGVGAWLWAGGIAPRMPGASLAAGAAGIPSTLAASAAATGTGIASNRPGGRPALRSATQSLVPESFPSSTRPDAEGAAAPRDSAAAPPRTVRSPALPVLADTPEVFGPRALGSGETSIADGDVYSSQDADVTPPRLTYPQLPPPVLADGAGPLNTIEVIIGTDGNVERVRLVSPPRRLPDMMLLSGAKNWVFVPAHRNGIPVRYRQLVSWVPGP